MGLRRWLGDKMVKAVAKLAPPEMMVKPEYFEMFQARGYHVSPVHFYQPIPDTRTLPVEMWTRRSALAGVDMNEAGQLRQLEQFTQYRDEYSKFPQEKTDDPRQFFLGNHSYLSVDAEVLHAMARRFKPKRMIEIGSGLSTLVAAAALTKNAAEGHPCDFTAIEPYPMEVLKKGLPGLTRVLPKMVQDVPLVDFEALEENDILFIDSTHVLMMNSDVAFEYLEILPRLKPGVIVHIHDIFLPGEYPKPWVDVLRYFWNEQYLLQAFLAFNKQFEVLWGSHFMHLTHPKELDAAFPSYAKHHWPPSSFWMKRV